MGWGGVGWGGVGLIAPRGACRAICTIPTHPSRLISQYTGFASRRNLVCLSVTQRNCDSRRVSADGILEVARKKDDVYDEADLAAALRSLLREKELDEARVAELELAVTARPQHGCIWQYLESGWRGWRSFEANGNDEMRQAYMKYLKGGPGTVQITSGGGRRDVDFKHMLQTNKSTGTRRQVSLSLDIPPAWLTPPGDRRIAK